MMLYDAGCFAANQRCIKVLYKRQSTGKRKYEALMEWETDK